MADTQDSSRRLTRLKKPAFACVPIAVLLIAVETGLWVVGFESPVADPYESFVLRHPLFNESDGLFTTAETRVGFFRRQSFAETKPPKTQRVFVFGGSTTNGYALSDPVNDNYVTQLGRLLKQNAPGTKSELINCGGLSYASYRLVDLVDECVHYSPDLIIVMSGHNEFLEARHYGDLMKSQSVPNQIWFSLRTVRLSHYLVNRFLRPAVALDDGRYVTERYIVRDEKEVRSTHDHYRRNLKQMLAACQKTNVPAILCTCTSNLEYSPFHSKAPHGISQEEIREFVKKASSELKVGSSEQLLKEAENLLRQEPECAAAYFVRGRCYADMGRMVEAKSDFISARDFDAFPKRSMSSFNKSVRKIALQNRVPLFDAELVFEQKSEHGIPGWNLFVDDCHPTSDGHRIIAEGLCPISMKLLNERAAKDVGL